VAAGFFESFADGADRMVKIAGRVEPNPEAKAIYDKKYALYRKTIEALEPVWGEFV
jgi:L-xylulokinase